MGYSASGTAAGEARPAGQQPPGTVRLAGMLTLSCLDQPDRTGHRHVRRRARCRVGGPGLRYVRDAIDAHGGPVLLDVAGLSFCDACGLGAFARMSRHAAQAGSSVRLVAPPPLLRKIIRITGLADQLPVHRADQAGHVQVA